MDRDDLSARNKTPAHENLRNVFEGEFGDKIHLDPLEYVVWLESTLLALLRKAP